MLILLAGKKEMRSAVSLTSPALAQLADIIAYSQLKLFTFMTGMFAENVTCTKFRLRKLLKHVGNFVSVTEVLSCLMMSALSILNFRGEKKGQAEFRWS